MCDHYEYEFMECKDGVTFWRCPHCAHVKVEYIDCTGG